MKTKKRLSAGPARQVPIFGRLRDLWRSFRGTDGMTFVVGLECSHVS